MVAGLLGYPYERLFCSTGNAGSIGAVRVIRNSSGIGPVRITSATNATRIIHAASPAERSRADQYHFS
jgi:hypothetical protein